MIVRGHLRKLKRLRVQVYDELTGYKMGGILRKRAILPRRFGRVIPGASPVVEAAHVAPAMLLEAFITERVGRAESSGHELPLGIENPKARLDQPAHMAAGYYTSLEGLLYRAKEAANTAANEQAGLLSRKGPSISVPLAACPVGIITGQAASALAAVGRDAPVELNVYDSRPTTSHEL